MKDFIYIGSCPCGEDAVQVKREGGYETAMRAQCEKYRELLRRKYGAEPDGARLSIKGQPHDFGTYYEVVCVYDDQNEAAGAYAFTVEAGAETWEDDQPPKKFPTLRELAGLPPIA